MSRVLAQLVEEISILKVNIGSKSHDTFAEIRRKIDIHREELKSKIDDVYMEMIEETKQFEVAYSGSLCKKIDDILASCKGEHF